MRPAAEVEELALTVERDRILFAEAGFEVFDFQRLPGALQKRDRFVAAHLNAFERLVFFDNLRHFSFDLREIVFRERLFLPKVVIEAVFNGRAERELDVFVKAHHGARHHVSAGVAHNVERFGVFFRQEAQFDRSRLRQKFGSGNRLGDRISGVVANVGRRNDRGDRRFGQAGADRSGDVDRTNAIFETFFITVGKNDFQHRITSKYRRGFCARTGFFDDRAPNTKRRRPASPSEGRETLANLRHYTPKARFGKPPTR